MIARIRPGTQTPLGLHPGCAARVGACRGPPRWSIPIETPTVPPPDTAPDSTLDVPREHERIARALRLPSASGQGVAHAGGDDAVRAQVLQSYCEALTSLAPRIALAWTWFGPPDTRLVVPQIVAGRAAAYARGLHIERNWVTAKGPVFRAIDGRGSQIFNVSPWSVYGPWRQVARQQGIRSVIALRLASASDPRRGLLVLYSDTERYFSFLGEGLFRSMAELFSLILSNEERR